MMGTAVALTMTFVLIEAVSGWFAHSLALLSDAGHNLADAAALGLIVGKPCYLPAAEQNRARRHLERLAHPRANRHHHCYGQPAYQPQTGSTDIAAYYYAGATHHMITVVNTSRQVYSGSLKLRASEENSHWQDLISGSGAAANGMSLPVSLTPEGILVLLQQS
jgi:hypothetical protein